MLYDLYEGSPVQYLKLSVSPATIASCYAGNHLSSRPGAPEDNIYSDDNHIDKLRVYQFSPCKMDGTKMREINNKEVRYITRREIDKHHFINADHHQNKYLSSVAGGRSSGQFLRSSDVT